MDKLLTLREAAKWLNVSQNTLRYWDKTGKLKPLRTIGGHRRYTSTSLDKFIGNKDNLSYETLYEHLCSAQYIAENLNKKIADQIIKIRESVGVQLLKSHENI